MHLLRGLQGQEERLHGTGEGGGMLQGQEERLNGAGEGRGCRVNWND